MRKMIPPPNDRATLGPQCARCAGEGAGMLCLSCARGFAELLVSCRDSLVLEGTDWHLEKQLASGACGDVWRALRAADGLKAAVKLLRLPPLPAGEQMRALHWRFQREIEAVSTLRHPGIVPIFESGIADGRPWYAMELIDGSQLDEWMKTSPPMESRLRLFQRICEAVHHAHRAGVIHRDLKPANIMVERETQQPKLVDFGLASFREGWAAGGTLTWDGQALGTPVYMSPEQARGDRTQTGVGSDVYALGGVLLWMFSKVPPYDPNDSALAVLESIRTRPPVRLREICPEAPRDLEAIVDKAMARDPGGRYAGADSLEADVARFLAGEAVAARREQRSYVWRKRLQRHWKGLAAATVALASLATAVLHSSFKNAELARRRAALLEQARSSFTLALLEADQSARAAGHPEWAGQMAERLASVPLGEIGGAFEQYRFVFLQNRFRAEWHARELRFSAAAAYWQKAAGAVEQQLAKRRGDQELRREAALARLGCGEALLAMLLADVALQELQKARQWIEGMDAAVAGDLPGRIDLETGRVHVAGQRWAEAEAILRSAAANSSLPVQCLAEMELAQVMAATGRKGEARALAGKSLAALKAAAAHAEDSRAEDMARLLALACMKGAEAMLRAEDAGQALQLLDEGLARCEALRAAGASIQWTHLRVEAEATRQKIGFHLAERHPAEACQVLETSLAHWREIRDMPNAHERQTGIALNIASVHRALGGCAEKLEDWQKAWRHYRAAWRRLNLAAEGANNRPDLHLDAAECAREAQRIQAVHQIQVPPELTRDWPAVIEKELAAARAKIPHAGKAGKETAARLSRF